MRASEGERLCQEAQVYYYDLLCQEEAAVPPVVRGHVAACPACQDQMRRLREALSEAQGPASAAGAGQDETIEALAQQFQLLDERVTCSEAKPRLPELAPASPRIRIPTPVTVHVDHCPQCAGDLAAIRELHLTAEQLKRLGRLLETGHVPPSNPGWEARDAGDGLVLAIPGSLSDKDAGIACHEIAMADLFDEVVPSGVTPSARERTSARQKAILRHVRSCPVCLEKVRTLRRTIDEIVARGDSEIVTVYHAENDAEQAWGDAEGRYPYPVSVQVLHGPGDAAVAAHATPAAPSVALRGLRRSVRPLATAALVLVVIVLAALLRTTTPTASGTNIGDVDKTLAKMKNVHIVTRDRNDKVIQEFWMARQSSVLVKTGENYVLYDLANDRRRTLDLQTGERTSERLSPDECKWARQIKAGYLRQMVAEITPDRKLQRAAGEIDSGAGQAFDVYELPLSPAARNAPLGSTQPGAAETRNPPERSRGRMYIDRATGLPQGMKFYRQRFGDGLGDPVMTKVFTYPTGPAMEEEIRALFPPQ